MTALTPHEMDWVGLSPLAREVLAALALGAVARPRSWLFQVLQEPALRRSSERRPSQEQVREVLQGLAAAGWLAQDLRRTGYWTLSPEAMAPAWRQLMEIPASTLRSTLAMADGYPELAFAPRRADFARLPTVEAAVALVRLEALHGAESEELLALERRLPWGCDTVQQLLPVVLTGLLREPFIGWLHPVLRVQGLLELLLDWSNNWHLPPGLDLRAAVQALLADRSLPMEATRLLRWCWAEVLLATGEHAEIEPVLAPFQSAVGVADIDAHLPGHHALQMAFDGAVASLSGDWARAERCYEDALATLRKLTGKRNRLLSAAVGPFYPLALLGRDEPEALRKALKFCLAEGGKREPVLDSAYGFIAHAIQIRLGEAPRRELNAFKPYTLGGQTQTSPLDLWRWLMRAWLKEGASPEPLPAAEADAAQRLLAQLEAAQLHALADQLRSAMAILAGETVHRPFFIRGARERWQVALDALREVVAPEPVATASADDARLTWVLELGAHGQVLGLAAQEQKRGVRGWGKPKEVPLTRLQRTAEALPPHDARVARTLKQENYTRQLRFDLAAAAMALAGHPQLVFDDALEQVVELTEAGPELDVTREGERLRVRLWPALHVASDDSAFQWGVSAEQQKELEALRLITIVRDSPQRARLIRLTPAQKRVAQLLGPEGLDIPKAGAQQLQEVLSSLGTHFRIHSDEAESAQAARDLPADPRLRAELSPLGDGLQLRLVAAPFGPDYAADGPRLVPGSGRARVVAAVRGEALGVQRDLAAERSHLDTVLNACPQLPPLPDGAPCEWVLDEAEQALGLVERLKPLNALQALDWPLGKAMRVDTAGLSALALRVHTRQEWLALEGELALDEALVLSLQQLMAMQAGAKSRFVPLGDNRFLALTQELRERLADLAAVAEHRAEKGDLHHLRIPNVAAPWLQQLAEGTALEVDDAFARQLERLDEARRLVPALPATLQAQLRPYQEEGFEWAMRLCHAGLGACLADDMGLGKTLQALAVLLARAGQGPALVVAPTSLVGNWRAEARRYAPSLTVQAYGEPGAERATQLATSAPGSVLLVSYALLQQEAERFAERQWATLVIDEAQAIKNAAAKRSQAVFALQARFRLALSGTPIENRLAELWSVMRACNPGLLGSLARFNERFAGPIERQRDKTAQRQLRRLIAPFILRRTKAQVLDDLPPRTELVLKVPLDDAEQAHYEALRREALIAAEKSLNGDAAGQAQFNILAGLTRLRRAACDPRLASPQLSLVGAKVKAFGELAAELVANGHKALVFSQFVDFLTLLKAPLDDAGIAYQYLDGSTPAAERMKRVDAFQAGQGELFLISLKAGGFGLNLTVADYVVIADPWWNPAAEDQASGRAHRIGQQRPVTVYRLVAEGTLEEKILTLHRDKRELADLLLEGGEGAALPSAQELISLMRETPEEGEAK